MYSDPLAETRTYQKLVNQGVQQALLKFVEVRFPSLTDLAQTNVPKVTKPDALDLLVKAVYAAPDESVVRMLLETAA